VTDVFVYDAVRSPRGKGKQGAPMADAALPHQLVAHLIAELGRRHDVNPHIEQLIVSCVGQTGAQGGHIGLVSKLEAGLPAETVVHSVNNYCVGGLSAIGAAANAIRAGLVDLAYAGGVEMMSHVPFGADRASYFTDPAVAGALSYAPPGIGADLLANLNDVDRETLDHWALRSHHRAAAAWDAGIYDGSVVAITGADGDVALARDETIVADMTAEKIAVLPPVFEEMGRTTFDAVIEAARSGTGPIEHRHTIAHCPPIADGASIVLLGSAEAGARHRLEPVARLVDLVEAAGDPILQLTAGATAMERVLDRNGLELAAMDHIEYMEAFAVVPALFERNYDVDMERVNPYGGHLAMGHPMGATGAILATAVTAELRRRGAGCGLAVAHGGAGVGVAAVFEAA
jgi:acetyl-CoA acetyltransferase family protein